ncbi:MAG: hypothetical protein PHN52_05845 [candidate division Zixibacteria bacterium]|nr:hypothetical protein [candidate division Zixibacteria bacterium]
MKFFLILLLCLVPFSLLGQDNSPATPEWFGLKHLTDYLGLQPADIAYRSDYTEPDSFRLKLVADLMAAPLGMIDYTATLKKAHVKKQPEIIARILFGDLRGEYQLGRAKPYQADISEIQGRYNLFYTDFNLNQLLTRAMKYIDVVFPRSAEMMLAPLTSEQRNFLKNQFKELIVMTVEEEFFTVQQNDSLEKLEEAYSDEFITFGTAIDKDPLVAAGLDCLQELMLEINALRTMLRSGQVTAEKIIEGIGYLPADARTETYLGRQPGWKIGGPGNDYYSGDYKFILDFGGNDIYDLTYDPANPHSVIIIDLAGDDCYRSRSDFTLGSGCFSVGLLLDFDGHDRYDARSFALGSGYFGFGLLYDAAGDDRYDGDTHVQGAGSFGMGLLIDEGGRDVYNAALYAQGFGFVQGLGMIYEMDGSDTYYAGSKYKDILRYKEHYLSLSQGFGYGLRPWMSGGIGAIIDLNGNDNYQADIFAQGCSYWWSLGVIYDSCGNDQYSCFQYGQGTATHMALGILIDDCGSDVYFGKGLMQGCGHDYSCGLILDRHGNDTYIAYDLSQGAGSANGAGILIDNEGNDRYLVNNFQNTQGYGNPRRDFGSIGLFIDLGGTDQYLGNGQDNYYWRTNSQWGGGMDIEYITADSLTGTKE